MKVDPIRELSLRQWRNAIWRATVAVQDRNLPLIAAGAAFFTFLSVFPALVATVSIWGLFADPALFRDSLPAATGILPVSAVEVLDQRLREVAGTSSDRLTVTTAASLALTLIAARAGVAALTGGLNAMYREGLPRNPFIAALRAILFTVILILAALVAIIAGLVVPVVVSFLPLTGLEAILISALKWVLATLILFAALVVIYRYCPNRTKAQLAWVAPGAILALLIWLLSSVGMSVFISRFADLNAIYGSIGAVIVLLLWLFAATFSVLFGALVNAELELQTKRDTTIPPEKPMGQRGAFVADTTVDRLVQSPTNT